MKYKILTLILLFVSLTSFGQLSGNYSIGGSSPDFNSFSDAIVSLTNQGVSGPVLFNIRDGVYVERLTIPEIPGASLINSIVFQSQSLDSNLVSLEYPSDSVTANNYLIFFDGADYITFKNISLKRTGTRPFARVINLSNGATNNSFLNNRFETVPVQVVGTNAAHFYSNGGTINDSNTIIRSNYLLNGSYAIRFVGVDTFNLERGIVIENNILENVYARGVDLSFQDAPIVRNNRFLNSIAASNYFGINCQVCDNNVLIEKNRIVAPNGGYGIDIGSSNGTTIQPINIINNFIQVGGSTTSYGIYLDQSSNINVFYNSVNITGTGSRSSALLAQVISTPELKIQNNVLANFGGGLAMDISTLSINGFTVGDYNNLYSNGPSLCYYGTNYTSTLSSWQAVSAKDLHSVSTDPLFTTLTDLHSTSSILNNAGTPIPLVATDIDDELRSNVSPDIGADEFLPLTQNVGILQLLSPAISGTCGDSVQVVQINMQNTGSLPISSIPLVLEISGSINQTILDTVVGPISPNGITSFSFSEPISTVSGGYYSFRIYSSYPTDFYRNNDTIVSVTFIHKLPNQPVATTPQQGCSTSAGISATSDSGDVILWFDQPVGGNLVGVGPTLNVPIHSDTIFYLEAHESNDGVECLKIVEFEPGSHDAIEIQNLSNSSLDATGWRVVVSNSQTLINSSNARQWVLGYFNAGEIQYKTDSPTDNYWGNDIFIGPGGKGWIMLLDSEYVLKDFLPIGWTNNEIQNMAPNIDGHLITIGTQWTGDGLSDCSVDSSMSRGGSFDNNSMADFSCEPGSIGTHNLVLNSILPTCGVGMCRSNRQAIQVSMVTGIITDLGPDTMFTVPFTYVLDAGSGFASYFWSDGTTNQTLAVSTPGLYWVKVTGFNMCSFTDSINITINTGILTFAKNYHQIYVFPNPVNDQLSIRSFVGLTHVQILDINGRVMKEQIVSEKLNSGQLIFDLSDVSNGLYFVRAQSENDLFVSKLIVDH